MHLTPAEYVIHLFGGIRPTSRALGFSATTIFQWKNYKDGSIPTKNLKKVLKIANEQHLDITPNDLIYGRIVEDEKPKQVQIIRLR